MKLSSAPLAPNEFTTFLGACFYASRNGGRVEQVGYWRWAVVAREPALQWPRLEAS